MTHQRKKPSLRSFQRQVLVFVGLTILVFGGVVYFAFSRTVIAVTPIVQTQTIDIDLTIAETAADVFAVADSPDVADLSGTVMEEDIDASVSVSALLEQREEPAKASGTVTITNNWSKAQPLQAGTRLLSSDGVQFRTTERVDVPAGGSADATVIADEAGKMGEVAPGRFEIVALWPGLKSQIYAESTEVFTGGTRMIARVTQADLNAARKSALAEFEKRAKSAIEAVIAASPMPDRQVLALSPTITNEDPGATVDDETSAFSYTLQGSAMGVVVAPSALQKALVDGATAAIPEDYRLLDIHEEGMTASVIHADPEKKTATVTISLDVSSVIRLSSNIFSRDAIAGRDRQEIQSHFSQFDDIASADIHFSPFWVLRASQLPDHIEIQLRDPVEK